MLVGWVLGLDDGMVDGRLVGTLDLLGWLDGSGLATVVGRADEVGCSLGSVLG